MGLSFHRGLGQEKGRIFFFLSYALFLFKQMKIQFFTVKIN